MSEATPTYNLPYPDLTDTPNVPSDMQGLAAAVEGALGPIDSRARLGQIICGEFDFNGNEGLQTITLPFQPQMVEFVTQVTTPTASSNAVATYSRGVLGIAKDGTIYQYNTGIRIFTGSAFERRTVIGKCAGLIIDDTTINNNCTGNLVAAGFTLNIATGTGNDDQTAFYVAHE